MDDLALNYMKLILGVDINSNVLIEIHLTYDEPFILTKKIIE
jgi:hypothetical protein